VGGDEELKNGAGTNRRARKEERKTSIGQLEKEEENGLIMLGKERAETYQSIG